MFQRHEKFPEHNLGQEIAATELFAAERLSRAELLACEGPDPFADGRCRKG